MELKEVISTIFYGYRASKALNDKYLIWKELNDIQNAFVKYQYRNGGKDSTRC